MDQAKCSQRLLITGATGFVGSALANYFYQKGFLIRAVARNKNHIIVKNHPEYEWIFQDLTQLDENTTLCQGVDFILHLAGYAHASKKIDPDFQKKHQAINYEATLKLAKQAKMENVTRFIFFSSVKAVADSDQKIDETWTMPADDPYGSAKYAAEEALLTMTGLESVILRLSLVYGVGWKGNLQTMLKAVDKNIFPPIPLINNRKSMVSLADVCLAAECAMSAPLAAQRRFIVTDGQTYSTTQIDRIMRKALGKKMPNWTLPLWIWRLLGKMGDIAQKYIGVTLPIHTEALDKLFGSACYQSCYIKEALGFIPQHTFSDIIPSIIDAYRTQK